MAPPGQVDAQEKHVFQSPLLTAVSTCNGARKGRCLYPREEQACATGFMSVCCERRWWQRRNREGGGDEERRWATVARGRSTGRAVEGEEGDHKPPFQQQESLHFLAWHVTVRHGMTTVGVGKAWRCDGKCLTNMRKHEV